MDRLLEKKKVVQRRQRQKLGEVRDRRRLKIGPVAGSKKTKTAPVGAKGTIFPNRVLKWDPTLDEKILKDGALNTKIGGDVMVGGLRGARIFTLSLEERATCPKSCTHWLTCYGNQMQWARRWKHGQAFEHALEAEVRANCATYRIVLVRLHVLGDFYSLGYLRLWTSLLEDLPNLHIFGFTAHGPDTKIGRSIARSRLLFGQRFSIRHSGLCQSYGSFTVDFPTEQNQIGDAIVCPEQRSANGDIRDGIHCGNCGLCWSVNNPIVFIQH